MKYVEVAQGRFYQCLIKKLERPGLYRTVLMTVLMFFGINTFTYAEANVLETFNANITRTAWQMYRSEYVQTLGFNLESREDLAAYDLAIIPSMDDTYWQPAPDPYIIGFAEKSRLSGKKDGNNGCKSAVDYSYFQTLVSVPPNVEVTEFNIDFSGIDEGARVSIFNSKHDGLIVPDSYVFLDTGGQFPDGQIVNLADYMTTGDNRVVVTQVDNCPSKYLGNLLETASISIDGIETITADAFLLQAVTSTSSTGSTDSAVIRTRVSGQAGDTIPTIEVLTSNSCSDGVLGNDATVFGELVIGDNAENVLGGSYLDANGDAFLEGGIISDTQMQRYAAVRVTGSSGVEGELSSCIVAGPDNDSWVRAGLMNLVADAGVSTRYSGNVNGYIDSAGKSRWFKFAIQPGARARIELSNLPADYDIAVFKDIGQAFVELTGESDVDGLNRLGAEFAPSVFSPSVFSPSVFSPSVFSPDAYSPSVFSPSVFSPSVFSPSVFSPSVFSPSVFSPSVFSPSVFSPSVFSPSVFSPSVFSPSVFSPSVFSDENYASSQVRSLITVSAQPGTVTERVIADTWNNTGYFYVRITGKNGANNIENPFQLSVGLEGVSCHGVEPVAHSGITAINGGYNSILLWDSRQLASSGSSQQEIELLEEKLNTLAARQEVKGVVVDLADFNHIQLLHAQADSNASCPYAANLTARAIKEIVDAYRDAGNPLAYVVIAGSDGEIPFFRYPDQGLLGPEQNYEPPMADGTQSQASLRRNYILGQDEYGASTSLSLNDGQFPVPDLAVGRLVETVPEMVTLINAYLSTAAGIVDTPTSSLVTGYDFLEDAASAVNNELQLGMNSSTQLARNDTLITDANVSPDFVCTGAADSSCSWTAEQLKAELLNEGEDIIFLAGHFSANSALAADYKTTALVTELASSNVNLTNSLVFSAGCHSGYNIVNDEIVPGLTLPLDWTQAFAQKGATLIAGTGYQYGDTDFIQYSERLYVQFARELRTGSGPVSIGKALVNAKQHYLSTTPDIRGLHRKSILISTLFGLPMLSVDLPGERITADTGEQLTPDLVDAGTPGFELGLATTDLALSFAGELQSLQVELTNIEDNTPIFATYLSGPDGIVTNPAEPALPLQTVDVSAVDTTGSALSLRGVGFRGGSWEEQSVVPFTGAPATELRGVHTPFSSLVNFPMRLATANYYGAITQSGRTNLHVTPAQYRVSDIGDTDATLRQFNNLDYRLFYSNNTQNYGDNRPSLAGPPSMTRVQAVIDGADVVFFVNVVGAPAAGIQSVWVTHTDGGYSSGSWQSLDLIQDSFDSTLWTGRLLGGSGYSRLDFMVQAANGVGLITVDDNYGAYYHLQNIGDAFSDLTFLNVPTNELSYGDTLQDLSVLLSDDNGPVSGAPVLFTLGETTRLARTGADGIAYVSLPLNMNRPGEYYLNAFFPGNDVLQPASVEQVFTITRVDTALSLNGPETVRINDMDYGFTAELSDAHGRPLLERTVYFTISAGPNADITIPVITDNTGVARLDISELALPVDNYVITARFLGNIPTADSIHVVDSPIYNASETFQSFSISRVPTILTLNGSTTFRADGSVSGFSATLTDDNGLALAGHNVTFSVGAYTEVVTTDVMGVASLSSLSLPAGNYTVMADFFGTSSTYQPSNAHFPFTVTKVLTALTLDGPETFRADEAVSGITAKLTDDFGMPLPGRSVTFSVGNATQVVTTDSAGVARLSGITLAAGEYTVTADYFGDSSTYEPSDALKTFTVTKVNTLLSIEGSSTVRADADVTWFTATLTDDNGMILAERSVSFNVGSITEEVIADDTGVASFSVQALPAGAYTVSANFSGDGTTYNPSTAEHSFTVIKVNTILTVESSTQVVAVDGIESGITATLTDDLGMPLPGRKVSFSVGDISVSAITNELGKAGPGTLALPARQYEVMVGFLGDSSYTESNTMTTLDLIGGANCPTSDTKGKISVTGFCFLAHRVDGKIAVTNGTLIVGSDSVDSVTYAGFVNQKIEQFGAGSVIIYSSASVRGMIVETGPGDVIVSGIVGEYGKVGGQVIESGDGDVRVNADGIVYGNTSEENAGSVIVGGTIEGNVFESGEGNIEILEGGVVTGGTQQD